LTKRTATVRLVMLRAQRFKGFADGAKIATNAAAQTQP
jgi:hypothetical protein